MIHNKRLYKAEYLKCCILIPSKQSYHLEGSATAGVVEFKNDHSAIDQAIAEMLRTAGDVVLFVLVDKNKSAMS